MTQERKYIFSLTGKQGFIALFSVLFVICTSSLFILQHRYYTRTYDKRDAAKFQEALHRKEALAEQVFDDISLDLIGDVPKEILDIYSVELKEMAGRDGIYFFYYENGRLAYWSDHTVPLRSNRVPRLRTPVYRTINSFYIQKSRQTEEGMLYALILIKTDYPFQNEYLQSGFQDDFKLGPEVSVVVNPEPALTEITDVKGEYLFSLNLGDNLKKSTFNVDMAMIFFLAALISLFLVMALRTDEAEAPLQRTIWLSLSVTLMLGLVVSIIYFKIPSIIFESELFMPDNYASLAFPSLGHLFVFVALILIIVLMFYWFFNKSDRLSKRFRSVVAYGLLLVATAWFIFLHSTGRSLVLDSTISFEAYKLDSLDVFTFIGMFILLMSFTVFCILIDKAIKLIGIPFKRKDYIWVLVLLIFGSLPFLFMERVDLDVLSQVFLIAFAGSMIYIRSSRARLKFSRFFPLILIFSLYTTVDLQKHTSEKLNAQKEIELAKLSSEHDYVAEMLFQELTDELRGDSLLISRLSYQIINADLMFEYLQRSYFSGYWNKYDLQITLCRPSDSVLIEQPENRWYPCYPFFNELVGSVGVTIEGSDFYFLNNLNGRISYLGAINYETEGGEITLFLELDSKIISEELGYPSLLMRQNQERFSDFSYARYNQGKLITSRGPFNYRLKSDYYTDSEFTFENYRSGGYEHSIFNVDLENTVIVSIPVVSPIDKMISFSYIFAFIFVIFVLSYLVASASQIRATVTWDFKNKIQYSVIGILFLTFLVICTGTIYFVIQQYRMKHQDNLENTMRSLYIELVHKVEYEEDLRNWSSENYYNLDELLRKFSNVFYTDINMYDENGLLLATSRSEIFDQQLLSLRMNREAFERLAGEDYSAYIHTERIGRMTYQSAYVPLLNSENRFLAYLNLPYFTQPEILAQEVTNLVVAILNTYVLLLLLILFLSVFMADRITQPLRFIQSRIAQLSLSKNNEKIVYRGKDEIAGLVDEYNYMVDELVKSAELLAQSERETAWREMAKQIAHEIKNPLTPMKLNIQHMLRMISEDDENIEEKVEQVSKTLIEQIDSLTAIANEFSDFAKMPKARFKVINIAQKLKNVATLFGNNEGLDIRLDIPGDESLETFGDPEQFQRVIINLVKNGMQSIPDRREKEISITLEKGPEDTAIISVSDNGKGIPEEIKDRLFQPNFTTKSGGMGMGLAISANIIKAMDGQIWYSTLQDKGTTFHIKVPLN